MRLRRLVTPALLGFFAASCGGDRVDGPTSTSLTATQRAQIAQRLMTAAGSGDGAASASIAAAVIMSGAQPTVVTATRQGGAAAVSSTNDAGVAASVAPAYEMTSYDAIAFQLVDRTFGDTVMGIVAWNATPDQAPTSFAVSYTFGEGTGAFDSSPDAASAFGYLFDAPSATWVATSGTSSMLRKSVGAACDNFTYPGVQAECHLATFTGALSITAAAPAPTTGNTATGSPAFSIPASTLGGVAVEITSTSAAVGRIVPAGR